MSDLAHPRGHYFEEFEIGYSIETPGRTVTEIGNGSVELLGSATPPAPELVSVQQVMADPDAEEWEGVLVSVQNVRVADIDLTYYEVTFTGFGSRR